MCGFASHGGFECASCVESPEERIERDYFADHFILIMEREDLALTFRKNRIEHEDVSNIMTRRRILADNASELYENTYWVCL